MNDRIEKIKLYARLPSNQKRDVDIDRCARFYLKMNYRFEKNKTFRFFKFQVALTYSSRGAWHTLYAMLPSTHK